MPWNSVSELIQFRDDLKSPLRLMISVSLHVYIAHAQIFKCAFQIFVDQV